MIASIVPSQNFELVRDRIASILKQEYTNQALLMNDAVANSGNYLASVVVDVELKKPIDKTEIPVVIVSVVEDNFSNKDVRSMDGMVGYAVDIYTSGKRTVTAPIIPGEKVAAIRLQKLLGLTRYILSDAIYKTLSFTPGIIGGVMVSGFQIRSNRPDDAENSAMARLVVNVKMIESNILLTAPPVSGVQTTANIDNTSLGYLSSEIY